MAPKNAAIRIAGAFFGPGRRKDDYPPGGMRWRGIPGAGPTFRRADRRSYPADEIRHDRH